MKKIVAIALCAGVGLLLTGTVRAEEAATRKPHGKGQGKERFEKADADKDGKLSLEEFKTLSTKPNAEQRFKAGDTDSDGFLTPVELKAAREKGAARREEKKDEQK
jgi:hypothetical protein